MGMRLFDEMHREDRWPEPEVARSNIEYNLHISIRPVNRPEARPDFPLVAEAPEKVSLEAIQSKSFVGKPIKLRDLNPGHGYSQSPALPGPTIPLQDMVQ